MKANFHLNQKRKIGFLWDLQLPNFKEIRGRTWGIPRNRMTIQQHTSKTIIRIVGPTTTTTISMHINKSNSIKNRKERGYSPRFSLSQRFKEEFPIGKITDEIEKILERNEEYELPKPWLERTILKPKVLPKQTLLSSIAEYLIKQKDKEKHRENTFQWFLKFPSNRTSNPNHWSAFHTHQYNRMPQSIATKEFKWVTPRKG